jgi:hypothetical protein
MPIRKDRIKEYYSVIGNLTYEFLKEFLLILLPRSASILLKSLSK